MPALSFIELLPSGQFRINPEAASYLERIQSPLAIVACAGKYRTGKSSLLNRVLLDVKGENGFGVGQTVQACTKGLWMHTDILGVPREDGSVMNVLIIDTEGLGAFNATSSHDSRIFSLALLISSYFIYNSVGTIDEQAVSTLSLVANISKLVKSKSNDSSNVSNSEANDLKNAAELGELFPDFLWVVRDFSLQLRDESGQLLTSDQYLEQALRDKPADGSHASKEQTEALQEKNHLRALLRAYFPNRKCVTMVRPCANEEDLQRVDSMPKEQMRSEFWETAQHVRSTVLGSAPAKTVAGGKPISGRGLLGLCKTYVDAMNNGVAPVIRDSWALLTEVQFRDAIETAEQYFCDSIESFEHTACDPTQMQKMIATAEKESKQLFLQECPDQSGPLFERFSARLSDILCSLGQDAQKSNLRGISDYAATILGQFLDNKKFETWKEFLDTAFNVASADFFSKIGRSDQALAAWSRAALPHLQSIAQNFGDRFDTMRAESERYRESAHKAEEWKEQLQLIEQELRDAQTKLVGQEADAQAQQEEMQQKLHLLTEEMNAVRTEIQDTSLVTNEEWQRREQMLRDETAATISKAEATAKQALLELERLKEHSEEARSDFKQRFDTMQRNTERSLIELRAANAQELDAINEQAEEHLIRAEEAESKLETLQTEFQTVKRKYDQISQRLNENETKLTEERSKNETTLQTLNEKWRQDVRSHHEEKLELTRTAKTAEAKLVLREQELALLREKLQEERPNVEAERAIVALERVEQESQRIRSELFEARRLLEEERATVKKLERQMRDQQRDHEMAQHNLKMNYEVEVAREKAQAAVSRRTSVSSTSVGSNTSTTQSKRSKLF